MRRLLMAFSSACLLANSAIAQDLTAYEAEAEQVLQRIRGTMMQELEKTLKIGPKAAISVCHHLAPEIEKQIAKDTGWEVRRTGLRVRNEANAPDENERGVMLSFEMRALAGQGAEHLRSVRLIERNGQKTVHFMQAVPMFGVCLMCHGKTVAPDVVAEIKRLYPTDQALGYDIRDIRGAFSLYKPYNSNLTAAPSEWSKIAALTLPTSVALNDQGKVGDAQVGRALFEQHCKRCHSPSDLAKTQINSRGALASAALCDKLATHGATDATGDCNIAAFLKVIGAVGLTSDK